MKNIKLVDVSLILVSFVGISFFVKLISILILGTIFSNVPSFSSVVVLQAVIAISIVLTGFIIGKLINWRIKRLPLYNALVVAVLACLFKYFRPDLNDLSVFLVVLYSGLTFISILVGAYITTNKNA